MLKATVNGKYYKNGRLVYTYGVTGTAKELEAYNNAQAEATGVAVAELLKTKTGQPLFWFVPNAAMGRIAKKSFILDISYNGKIVIDDTHEGIDRDMRVAEKSEDHEARLLAEAKFGLIKLGGVTAGATAKAPKVETLDEQPLDENTGANETEETMNQLQGAGAEGNEDLNG